MRYFIITLILIMFLTGGIFLPRDFNSDKEVIFHAEKNEGSDDIAVNLQKDGLIWWSPLFRVYVLGSGVAGKLQAGCYLLSPSMNIQKIAGIFSSGDIAKEKITIPEGFTSEQIYQKLKDITKLDRLILAEYEGYLFPDTYEIPYCMEQDKIIKMMLNNFNRKTAELKITKEAVVMASLLEEELKTKEDKEIASGILWKRLKAGVPLQVDAFMWTYENYGLPEKPIANPGLESIGAALHPKESQFWYYLSTPDGKTILSRTLEEHNIAKARYLTGK